MLILSVPIGHEKTWNHQKYTVRDQFVSPQVYNLNRNTTASGSGLNSTQSNSQNLIGLNPNPNGPQLQ